jgi:hypothetical protein
MTCSPNSALTELNGYIHAPSTLPLCTSKCRSSYRLNKRQRGHRHCLNDGSSTRADFLYWESNQDLAAVQFVAWWMHLQGYALYAYYCSCFHGSTVLVGLRLLIVEVSRPHLDTPHSVRLLWTIDQPEAEISTWKKPNNYTRETSLPRSEFEPAIATSEWPQTHTLDRVASGIGT